VRNRGDPRVPRPFCERGWTLAALARVSSFGQLAR